LHIETVVKGGRAEDPFFTEVAPKYGFRSMCHTGKFSGIDTIRSLSGNPSVVCWMLSDEPDWSTEPVVMVHSDKFVRDADSTKPTMITLCRNVKFFEYAAIADIPCMDHYCVTAPTSSKWVLPPYGTRLEETAYYTRDLKAASEPKPIWVWSQAIAGWEERPKMPVASPEELAAQLAFNLGRGAKGIIWFNYSQDLARKFVATREAMRGWGRVLRVLREDFLSAEPIPAQTLAPDKVDVAVLVHWDKVIVIATNQDYEIVDDAYPFHAKEDVQVSVKLPSWVKPAVAVRVGPEGVSTVPCKIQDGTAHVEVGHLETAGFVVLANDTSTASMYQRVYEAARADETRTY
jgi:hypothetical protein